MLRWKINKLDVLFAITWNINVQKADIFVDCIIYSSEVEIIKKIAFYLRCVSGRILSLAISPHANLGLSIKVTLVRMEVDIKNAARHFSKDKEKSRCMKNLKKERNSNRQLFLWFVVLLRLVLSFFAKIKAIDHWQSDEFEFVQQP